MNVNCKKKAAFYRHYWTTRQMLKPLELLIPPATSSACERNFSYAKKIHTDQRASLGSPNLIRAMFIKANFLMLMAFYDGNGERQAP